MEKELYRWWLPPPAWKPNGNERLSSWHMDAEEAKKHGALRRDDGSRMVVRDMQGSGTGLGIVLAGGGAASRVVPRIPGPALQQLPAENVDAARVMYGKGWRAASDRGELRRPPGDGYAGGWHITADWTWMAMTLMELEQQGTK